MTLKAIAKSKRGKNSYFISFEGIEGSGKSTQIKELQRFLEKEGFRVLLLREPGGTAFGETLRAAMLQAEEDIHPLAQAHLFAASRAQLLSRVILPALQEDQTVVLVDRFIDSSLSYQGQALGLGFKTILDIHRHPPLNTLPDLTFYLAISLRTSLRRQKKRGQAKDYYESQRNAFHQSLIDGLDALVEIFPQRLCRLNGEQSQKAVTKDMLSALHAHWKKKK